MLDGNLIVNTLRECLVDTIVDGKPTEGTIMAKGAIHTAAFIPDVLESKRELVCSWFDELPPEFTTRGDSFLNMCMDKDNHQWGEHQHMDALLMLAVGLGLARVSVREMWHLLPGGMPLVRFSKTGFPPPEDKEKNQ